MEMEVCTTKEILLGIMKELGKMQKHIREFTIHAYKGIYDLNLEHLNSINILDYSRFPRE